MPENETQYIEAIGSVVKRGAIIFVLTMIVYAGSAILGILSHSRLDLYGSYYRVVDLVFLMWLLGFSPTYNRD